MPDQVPEAVKKERSEKLLALGHRMSGSSAGIISADR